MKFEYGFESGGFTFGWYQKNLYRLPQEKDKRAYALKKMNPITIGNKTGYRIRTKPMTLAQLEAITVKIKPVLYNSIKSEHTPF